MMATILRTNGTKQEVKPRDGKYFQLDELKAVVGGWIEIVGLADGRLMVVNEEGKIDNLPPNAEATELFNQGGRLWFDVIVGDVIVCISKELE